MKKKVYLSNQSVMAGGMVLSLLLQFAKFLKYTTFLLRKPMSSVITAKNQCEQLSMVLSLFDCLRKLYNYSTCSCMKTF